MKTLTIAVLFLFSSSLNAQVYIDGKVVSPNATYITSVFFSRASLSTVDLQARADDGEKEGFITNATGVPLEFSGTAEFINAMDAAGWEYAGAIAMSYVAGKGITAAAPRPMPESTLFRRK